MLSHSGGEATHHATHALECCYGCLKAFGELLGWIINHFMSIWNYILGFFNLFAGHAPGNLNLNWMRHGGIH
jgi:hypothetical protein